MGSNKVSDWYSAKKREVIARFCEVEMVCVSEFVNQESVKK